MTDPLGWERTEYECHIIMSDLGPDPCIFISVSRGSTSAIVICVCSRPHRNLFRDLYEKSVWWNNTKNTNTRQHTPHVAYVRLNFAAPQRITCFVVIIWRNRLHAAPDPISAIFSFIHHAGRPVGFSVAAEKKEHPISSDHRITNPIKNVGAGSVRIACDRPMDRTAEQCGTRARCARCAIVCVCVCNVRVLSACVRVCVFFACA